MRDELTPAALQTAIAERARNEARRTGANPGDLTIQFYLSRLLTRVFSHERNGWMLKGGQALLVRWPDARHSRDIDLLATGDNSDLDNAVTRLRAATSVDLGDFIRFEHHSTSAELQEREIRKVKFTAYCGTRSVGVVSVDVVTGLSPLGEPVDRPLELPFDIDLEDAGEQITARMWPLEDHVADKIAAMYEIHTTGPSSRYRDLVDLIIIATSSDLDGDTAHTALRKEVQRRIEAGVVSDITLPEKFSVPDRKWASGYAAAAKSARGLDKRFSTLRGAEEIADRFVSPLLTPEPPGRWDHQSTSWSRTTNDPGPPCELR